MKQTELIRSVATLVGACLCASLISAGEPEMLIKSPRIVSDYVNVYQPRGDVFQGPSTPSLTAGQFYQEWVANDHCFVKDDDGFWHSFGITHPYSGLDDVHEGENVSFHAVAPKGPLKEVLRECAWKDKPKVLSHSERPGDIPAHHAPTVTRKDNVYYMIWGPGAPLRYATSSDLYHWNYQGRLLDTPDGRDPSLLLFDGTYYLVTCGGNSVNMAVSQDLQTWQKQPPIITRTDKVDMESPTLLRYNGTFYLFVCGWNNVWDKKDIAGAYQHITYVYQSDNPMQFDHEKILTTLNAHAPEIFQDEDGDWYISSVEWPSRGVSIARLAWE